MDYETVTIKSGSQQANCVTVRNAGPLNDIDNRATVFVAQNRVSIKRSPAFYKNNRADQTAKPEIVVKRSSLKRKPGVDKRSSRPTSLIATLDSSYQDCDQILRQDCDSNMHSSLVYHWDSNGVYRDLERGRRDFDPICRDSNRINWRYRSNSSWDCSRITLDRNTSYDDSFEICRDSSEASSDDFKETLAGYNGSYYEPDGACRDSKDFCMSLNDLHLTDDYYFPPCRVSKEICRNPCNDIVQITTKDNLFSGCRNAKEKQRDPFGTCRSSKDLRSMTRNDPDSKECCRDPYGTCRASKELCRNSSNSHKSLQERNEVRRESRDICREILESYRTFNNDPASLNVDFSIVEALRAPLPAGPAPKKPPRTFTHDAHVERGQLRHVIQLPVPAKITRARTEPHISRRKNHDNLANQTTTPAPRNENSLSLSTQPERQSTVIKHHQRKLTYPATHKPTVNQIPEFRRKSNPASSKNYQTLVEERWRSRRHLPNAPLFQLIYRNDGPGLDDKSSFSDYSDTEADMYFKQAQLVQERKYYIQRISSSVSTSQKPKLSSTYSIDINNTNRLFDCLIIASIYYDHHLLRYVPYIQGHFPSNVNLPEGVEQFCYPDSSQYSLTSGNNDFYTIVLTDNAGKRQYGYCHRKIVEDTQTSLTFCLLSKHRASGFYNKLLSEVTARYGRSAIHWNKFLEALHSKSFPVPGETLQLSDPVADKVVKIARPLDIRLEDSEFCTLFDKFDKNTITNILGTLLLERKLLFIGKDLSAVCSCVQAVQLMLYPFTWQHTLVPVLPKAMAEICSAPTPYIMGILTDNVTELEAVQPDQGIMVDVDSGETVRNIGDESSLLPRKAVRSLHAVWELTEELTENAKSARHALFSESFLRFFVELCGHYGKHVKTNNEGKRIFEKTAFVEGHSSQSVRLFLEWFTETAMFNVFIESRLKNATTTKGLFEQKIMERSIQMVCKPQLDAKHTKTLGRKIKNIGGKLKEMSVF